MGLTTQLASCITLIIPYIGIGNRFSYLCVSLLMYHNLCSSDFFYVFRLQKRTLQLVLFFTSVHRYSSRKEDLCTSCSGWAGRVNHGPCWGVSSTWEPCRYHISCECAPPRLDVGTTFLGGVLLLGWMHPRMDASTTLFWSALRLGWMSAPHYLGARSA